MKRKVIEMSSMGNPCKTREESRSHFRQITRGLGFHSVHGDGPMMMSDLRFDLKKPVKMGIDEAGRGSVIGPMTYGAAYWTLDVDAEMEKKGFDDSKQLTHEKRLKLFRLMENTPEVSYIVRVLHAPEISRKMLRPSPYNLNEMSHDTAMDMIRAVLNAGVNLTECYIDTVGQPESYQAKLERTFAGKDIKFTVAKKADSLYKTTSAASIAAKVARDEIVENWKFSEEGFQPENGIEFGSGYPSDPKCKAWLEKNFQDEVFAFPDAVRFSWAPIKQVIEEKGTKIKWEADDDMDDAANDQGQMSMSSFVKTASNDDKMKKTRLGGRDVTNNFSLLPATEFF